MDIIGLFSGAGGLDMGFERAGFNVIWANEFDKKIWDTYSFNHPNTKLETRSIIDIKADEIPDCDGIIGGPPCQSWSLAGSMRGIDDKRGQLFLDYLRILEDKKPKFFVAENVPGMLSPTHIKAFLNIRDMFIEAGYNVNYKLLNSNDYGVPQERKRVILVGYREDLDMEFDFDKLTEIVPKPTLRDAIADLPEPMPGLEKNKTNGETEGILNNEYFIGGFSSMFMSRNRRRDWSTPSFTIQAGARHAPIWPGSCEMEKLSKNEWKFTSENYRRMSIRECARVQTFPDNFKFIYENLAEAYKMIGNAVPVKLAEVIANQIMKDFREKGIL